VSKVRSLTLDRLDSKLLALIQEVGNEKANQILEHGIGNSDRPTGTIDQGTREAFIRRKYAVCEFVEMSPAVDIERAIVDRDLLRVLHGICQCKKTGLKVDKWLHMAAAGGDPTVSLLIGLNSVGID
jgi:hypothetical protein